MDSLNFDNIADNYNETRTINKNIFLEVIEYITSRFPPSKFKKVFEPGIGNGRIAIPFSKKGYSITGVDISEKMLDQLEQQLKSNHISNIKYKKADITEIPFEDNSFDLCIIVHLFYFIKEWKKAVDEIARVVNGSIILMNTGLGQEIPLINNKYKEICLTLCYPINNIGVNSTAEVIDYFKKKNFIVENVDNDWKWNENVKLEKAYNNILKKSYSFTHLIDNKKHIEVCGMLKDFLIQRFGTLKRMFQVENKIVLNVLSRKENYLLN